MSPSIEMITIVHGVHFAVGAMLILSALHKFSNLQSWTQELDRYEVLSGRIVTSFASRIVPFLELTIGIALAAQVWPVASALGATFLFAIFFGVVSYAVFQTKEIPCGCLGGVIKGGTIGRKTVFRLLLLIGILLGTLFIISQDGESLVKSRTQWLENLGLGMIFGVPILLLWILSELLPEARNLINRPPPNLLRSTINDSR